jgi:hypothetical protein
MYAAQTIIDVIITEIITELTAVTGEVITGAGLTVKDTSGQVVTLESGVNGDRKYSGLDDSKGTYFYIRINGNITEGRKPANTKRGSCGIESEIRIPLKLVIQHRCADPRKLLDVVKSALFTANLKQNWLYNIVNVKLYPTSSNVLPWDVYNSETGKEAKTMNSLLQIVSTDFELRFDFNYNNKCDDFNLCVPKIKMPACHLLSFTEYVTINTIVKVGYWNAYFTITAFINAILAHPNYAGGLTIVENAVYDLLGNLVGIQTYTGYDLNVEQIPLTNMGVIYNLELTANFNFGTISNVKYTLTNNIKQADDSYNVNNYICTDL